MDGPDLATLVEVMELLYVFSLCPSRRELLDSIDLSSLATKVTSQTSSACGDGGKADLIKLCMVSVYRLWMCDYLFTLGDEVRCPCIFQRRSQV